MRTGHCQYCHREFQLTSLGVIPLHRSPGDEYECSGGLQICAEDAKRVDDVIKGEQR